MARKLLTAKGMKRCWRGSFVLLTLSCFLVVALADWLFYEQPMGWTLGLFGAVVTGLVLLRPGRALREPSGRILLVAISGLVLALAAHRGIIAAILLAAAVFALAAVHRGGWTADIVEWARRLGRFLGAWPAQLARDWMRLRRHHRGGAGPGRARRLVRLWIVPVLLGGVFVILFAAANPVISGWFVQLDRKLAWLFAGFGDFLQPLRLFGWGVIAFGIWALLRFRVGRRSSGAPPLPAVDDEPSISKLVTPALLERCLLVFNGIFAVQSLLDIYYLWGGAALPDGMTYAEYAHRGAYPLMATALLAATFVLATFRPGAAGDELRRARQLVYLWIGQNIFLVFSAVWRLVLYVEQYSLTQWRLAAAIWMLLVACGLVWIVVRIVTGRSNAWLMGINAVTLFVVLYGCALAKPDSAIARYNVEHCAEVAGTGPPIDVYYLHSLGTDALPAVRWLVENLEDPSTPEELRTAEDLTYTQAHLEAQLHYRLADWRGWTLSTLRMDAARPDRDDTATSREAPTATYDARD